MAHITSRGHNKKVLEAMRGATMVAAGVLEGQVDNRVALADIRDTREGQEAGWEGSREALAGLGGSMVDQADIKAGLGGLEVAVVGGSMKKQHLYLAV
jgi:hypothetical protein